MQNGVMLQSFEWYLPADGTLWKRLTREIFRLRGMGITALWLPPAYKGCGGKNDVGYGVYDLYDLGEFDQKGTVATKYGTASEYRRLIRAIHQAGAQALADVVLNHRITGDEMEQVPVYVEDFERRNDDTAPVRTAGLMTRLTFPGRRGRYSSFIWDASCFTGTDWDAKKREHGLFRIVGKRWAEDVDGEHGNYDYLMGLDVDVQSEKVRTELKSWGLWYTRNTGCDGYRLDAVKHISAGFYRDWLDAMRRATGRELFSVGEYWHADARVLCGYLDVIGERMNLFDVPLHFHLREASCNRFYDMAHLFDGTLVGCRPHVAVTFVDNHDTQPGQALESWVSGWFRPAAYGLLLLRAFGYPCVFWGDVKGIPNNGYGPVAELPKLLRLRKRNAYGEERDYFDDTDVIGFTRAGDEAHPGSGLAFLCTNAMPGDKRMQVGKRLAGRRFRCVMGKSPDVRVDRDGWGTFHVDEQKACAWVPAPTWRERLALGMQGAKEKASLIGHRIMFMLTESVKKS